MKIEVVKGKDWVYRAMLATMGKKPKRDGLLRDDVWFLMLRAKHSCVEEYEIWIDAEVTERTHTHIVRHKEIGKYVATSRPDLNGKKLIIDGIQYRQLSLRINAKRLMEICEQRLCRDASIETRLFVENIVDNLDDEILKSLCVEPCVKYGICIGKKKCNYVITDEFHLKRINFEKL